MRPNVRLGLFYACAGMAPISALSLSIFGLWTLQIGALLLVVPAILLGVVIGLISPAFGRLALKGFLLGLLAVALYDCFRGACILYGLMGDFIPKIGGWITGQAKPNWMLGYLWRYVGNGGGMGMAFFVFYSQLLAKPAQDSVTTRSIYLRSISAGLIFGLGIWGCLMITLLASTRGQEMMFAINAESFWVSLFGHVIFGLVLGAFTPAFSRPKIVPRKYRLPRAFLRQHSQHRHLQASRKHPRDATLRMQALRLSPETTRLSTETARV